MGVDLYIVTPDPGEKERVEAAWAAVEAARGGSREETSAAWRQFFDAQRGYHRFSWHSMHVAVCRMDVLGMLTDEAPPPWPDPDAYGIDAQNFEAACPKCRSDYQRDTDKVRAYGSADGIPADKFGTNDQWLVRPDQIDAALTAYDRHPAQSRALITSEDPQWADWIDFLKRARDRDGFTVY